MAALLLGTAGLAQAHAPADVSDVPTGLTHTPGASYAVRVQAEGASPTHLRARVWKAGTPEPSAWQLSATDAGTGPQAAGTVGVRTVNTTGAPANVAFDDLLVTGLVTGATAMRASVAGAGAAAPGEEVRLAAEVSDGPEDFPVTYAWDLDGDHSADDASGPEAVARFGAPGEHRVALHAIASDGSSSRVSHVVTVRAPEEAPEEPEQAAPQEGGAPAAAPPPSTTPHDGSRDGARGEDRSSDERDDDRPLFAVARRLSYRSALRRGLRVRCRAERGETCRIELRISAATARRLGLRAGRRGGPVVVARARVRGGRSGRVRLSSRLRRGPADSRRTLRVEVRVTASGGEGDAAGVAERATVVLRR